MRNIKLTIAYDGTDFHGWQMQPGQSTIQGHLVEIARKITQENLTVYGAGRTDAGVHARGQVAHFRTGSHLTPREFRRAFNALLPPTIRVLDADEVGPTFHARHQALSKTYSYRFYRGGVVPPFIHRYVLHYPGPLDESAMAEAAQLFEGEHDFTFFSAPTGNDEDDEPTPIRTVLSSELRREGGADSHGPGESCEVRYVVQGRSFLRYMVRKIAGTLLEVGRGKMRPAEIPALFEIRDRSRSAVTLPACGLTLEGIEYHEPWKNLS